MTAETKPAGLADGAAAADGATAAVVPVITIDGPAASGKGTIAQLVARELGFHYLDSGKLYRAAALAGITAGVAPDDTARLRQAVAAFADNAGGAGDGGGLTAQLKNPRLLDPEVSRRASLIATDAVIRARLIPLQQAMRRMPGLVADGRDMGTVVFADAGTRVFLTADARARAQRRHKQLRERGINAIMADVFEDLKKRDEQDENRAVAPLKPPPNALFLDSTNLSISAVADEIIRAYRTGAPT